MILGRSRAQFIVRFPLLLILSYQKVCYVLVFSIPIFQRTNVLYFLFWGHKDTLRIFVFPNFSFELSTPKVLFISKAGAKIRTISLFAIAELNFFVKKGFISDYQYGNFYLFIYRTPYIYI